MEVIIKLKTYISLLRGINVAGKKKILMKDLTALYESLGLEKVATFIQSGNVVFNSAEEAKILVGKIEEAIASKYDFEVSVQLREVSEFESIIQSCPFNKLDLEDATKVMVIFLDAIPKIEDIEELMTHVKAPDKLVVLSSEIYFYCPNGYGITKLNNAFIEKKLKVSATTRNWKSVMRICILAMGNKVR